VLEPDIYLLQLAGGVRDALIKCGFSTIKFVLECTTSDISSKVGIDLYVAKIIFEEAKRVTKEMATNGTMKGNIEYSKAGEYVSVSKGNNLTFDRRHGVIKTKNGSETANYTFIEVGNGTAYQGASAYSTNSIGKLSLFG
jgi:hypothetical protein